MPCSPLYAYCRAMLLPHMLPVTITLVYCRHCQPLIFFRHAAILMSRMPWLPCCDAAASFLMFLFCRHYDADERRQSPRRATIFSFDFRCLLMPPPDFFFQLAPRRCSCRHYADGLLIVSSPSIAQPTTRHRRHHGTPPRRTLLRRCRNRTLLYSSAPAHTARFSFSAALFLRHDFLRRFSPPFDATLLFISFIMLMPAMPHAAVTNTYRFALIRRLLPCYAAVAP